MKQAAPGAPAAAAGNDDDNDNNGEEEAEAKGVDDDDDDDDGMDVDPDEQDSGDDNDDSDVDDEEEAQEREGGPDAGAGTGRAAPERQQRAPDVNHGCTVFVRNVAFDCAQEEIKERFSEFGDVRLALLVKDRATGMPRGTAFVKVRAGGRRSDPFCSLRLISGTWWQQLCTRLSSGCVRVCPFLGRTHLLIVLADRRCF